MKQLQTLGRIKVIRPNESKMYKDEKTGFVAVDSDGYEYWDFRQSGAIKGLLDVKGADAI